METVRILVPVKKMAATVRFYEDGLGLQEEQRADGAKAFVVAGQQRIELVPLRGPLLETRTKVRFHVHGIQECIGYLVSSGLSFPRRSERALDAPARNGYHGSCGERDYSARRRLVLSLKRR